jgi:hypothetical protein
MKKLDRETILRLRTQAAQRHTDKERIRLARRYGPNNEPKKIRETIEERIAQARADKEAQITAQGWVPGED